MKKILNYINGALVEPQKGEWLDNINPANGEVYSLIPDSDASDVDLAVEAAEAAKISWANTPAKKRSDYLLKIARGIEVRMEEFARAETIDNGKPISLSRAVDIPRAVSNFEFFATAVLHDVNESHQTDQTAFNYTYRKPIGLAGCISPWNLPIYLFSWKIAPALAAGCPVIAKPSEVTPMTAYLLSEVCVEVGLPPGVLNIVHGLGPKVGQRIVEHPQIPAISFTGGTSTGQHLARTAAPMFKKLSLELGGKNPNIIFADCDFDDMLSTTIRSSFANQGQICLCGSRIYVERSIYNKFRDAFVAKVSRMQVGDPLDDKTKTGAVVSQGHMEKVLSYIQLAREEGGNVLCGGERVFPEGKNAGFYIQPTVIDGLDEQCRTNQEEIFGPVVTLQPFDTEEEAIGYANATPYGLASTIWTSNLKRAHRVAHQIDSGITWINCWLLRDLRTPFGGVKQSGVGREGGFHALHFFTEEKNVCVKL